MSIDLVHPPPSPSPETSLKISQLAPQVIKHTSRTQLPYPFSLLTGDQTSDTWTSLENLYMQCLRTGDDKSARQILDRLVSRFGERNERVMAYQGMWEEATAQNEDQVKQVLNLYNKLLEEDPANIPIQKRRIALLKSMGQLPEAIAQLNTLLRASPTDAEAWAELADLYLSQGLLDQSIFCLEEVLLVQPNAWNIHAKIAEIIYMSSASASGNAVELARILAESMRRYLRSIELCENYLRGFYGLKLTSSRLLEVIPQASKSSTKDDAYSDLALPTQGTVESIHELATSKLAEILRRNSARETGWDGYDPVELAAARKLLDSKN